MKKSHPDSNHSFDETYIEKEEMFGHPYQELQDYFKFYPTKGTVLDLGCGQGRDSLYLASIGYQVTAVDNSKIGIQQMISKAHLRKLKINSIVDDVLNLKLEERFDIILFDMLLHSFEKRQQCELLRKYSSILNKNGILCIVFPDDIDSNHFMNMLKSLQDDWNLKDEITIKDVPKVEGEDSNFTFIMMVVQVNSVC